MVERSFFHPPSRHEIRVNPVEKSAPIDPEGDGFNDHENDPNPDGNPSEGNLRDEHDQERGFGRHFDGKG